MTALGRRRPLRHVTFGLGVVITLLLVATAALSLVWTPADPLAMSIAVRLQGPTGAHPFGTDHYGRDVLSRVMRCTALLSTAKVPCTFSVTRVHQRLSPPTTDA